MNETDLSDIQTENAYYDAEDIARSLNRDFVDADIPQFKDHGVDLRAGAIWFIQHYKGKSAYINSMMARLQASSPLTQPMVRATLNIMREELGLPRDSREVPAPNPRQSEQVSIQCFQCQAWFPTWEIMVAHKATEHGGLVREEPIAQTGEAKRVIEKTTADLGLDLSGLADGRYAAPDPSGKNDYVFLMVKRVRRTHNRDRRYIYGKIITGNEIVVAGTIEVKIWSSDSKELIGEQKPGEVYRGKYEKELELIMLMPEPWAKLFGKLMKHCCICGKPLTDDESRAIGLGLECEKKQAYFKKPPRYSYVGADRPDKWKADPRDQDYLEGRLTRYVPFKPTAPAGVAESDEGDDD